MFNKDEKIESYEGQDAFYSGTDEEYEEFLKNADIKMNDGEEAEAVANTQKINLNETINIQSVIDKFKKTAGGIESSAKKIKDSVVSKMDAFKVKKEDETDAETVEQETETTERTEKQEEVSVVKTVKCDGIEEKIQTLCDEVSSLSAKMKDISSMLDVIEVQSQQRMKEHDLNCADIKQAVEEMGSGVNEIRQAVNSVSKLNDSLFDLKNTQLNTKKALSDIETSFVRLKKKCVLGVTVLSILSAIVIVLEIILMLS